MHGQQWHTDTFQNQNGNFGSQNFGQYNQSPPQRGRGQSFRGRGSPRGGPSARGGGPGGSHGGYRGGPARGGFAPRGRGRGGAQGAPRGAPSPYGDFQRSRTETPGWEDPRDTSGLGSEQAARHPVSILQEMCQKMNMPAPVYQTKTEVAHAGGDFPPAPSFACRLSCQERTIEIYSAPNLKDAKKIAADLMLNGFYPEHTLDGKSHAYDRQSNKTMDKVGWHNTLDMYRQQRIQQQQIRIQEIQDSDRTDEEKEERIEAIQSKDMNPPKPAYGDLSSNIGNAGAKPMSIYNEACQKNHLKNITTVQVGDKPPTTQAPTKDALDEEKRIPRPITVVSKVYRLDDESCLSCLLEHTVNDFESGDRKVAKNKCAEEALDQLFAHGLISQLCPPPKPKAPRQQSGGDRGRGRGRGGDRGRGTQSGNRGRGGPPQNGAAPAWQSRQSQRGGFQKSRGGGFQSGAYASPPPQQQQPPSWQQPNFISSPPQQVYQMPPAQQQYAPPPQATPPTPNGYYGGAQDYTQNTFQQPPPQPYGAAPQQQQFAPVQNNGLGAPGSGWNPPDHISSGKRRGAPARGGGRGAKGYKQEPTGNGW